MLACAASSTRCRAHWPRAGQPRAVSSSQGSAIAAKSCGSQPVPGSTSMVKRRSVPVPNTSLPPPAMTKPSGPATSSTVTVWT